MPLFEAECQSSDLRGRLSEVSGWWTSRVDHSVLGIRSSSPKARECVTAGLWSTLDPGRRRPGYVTESLDLVQDSRGRANLFRDDRRTMPWGHAADAGDPVELVWAMYKREIIMPTTGPQGLARLFCLRHNCRAIQIRSIACISRCFFGVSRVLQTRLYPVQLGIANKVYPSKGEESGTRRYCNSCAGVFPAVSSR